ncbi:MAG: hypothetical protein AAF447_21935 [Myxococcota bacterium]
MRPLSPFLVLRASWLLLVAAACTTGGAATPTSTGFDVNDAVSATGTPAAGTRVIDELPGLMGVELEADGLTLVLDAGTPADGLPGVGDVLVSGPRPEAPYGFARKILAVRDLGGDRYDFDTRHATLTEIFQSLDLRSEITPRSEVWTDPADPGRVGRATSPLNVENRIELFPTAGTDAFRCGNGGLDAQITAILELAPELYTDVRIREDLSGPIDAVRSGILESARLGMGGLVEVGFEGRIRGEAGLRCTSTFTGTPIEHRTTILVGGVPTVITHIFTPQVEVLVTLGAALDLQTRTTSAFRFEAGVEKPSETEDWRFLEGARLVQVTPPEVPPGRVELRVQVDPSVQYTTLLYDAIGPAVGLGLSFDARLGVDLVRDACPTFDVTAAVTAGIGAEVRLPVISRPRARVFQDWVLLGPESIFGGPIRLCEEDERPEDPDAPPLGDCAPIGDDCIACITAGCGWCAEGCVDLRNAGGRLNVCDDGDISTILYRECPSDPCSAATDCGACDAMEGCGWCGDTGGAGTGTCLSDVRSGECGPDEGHWRNGEGACTDCTTFTDCSSCADNLNCGWCPATGCVSTSRDLRRACGDDAPWPVTLDVACDDYESVDDRCASHAACGECTRDVSCFWCTSTGSCDSVRRLEAGSTSCRGADADFLIDPNACEPCDFTDCRSCATNGFCQWCDGRCLNDSRESCEGDPAVNPAECG